MVRFLLIVIYLYGICILIFMIDQIIDWMILIVSNYTEIADKNLFT